MSLPFSGQSKLQTFHPSLDDLTWGRLILGLVLLPGVLGAIVSTAAGVLLVRIWRLITAWEFFDEPVFKKREEANK